MALHNFGQAAISRSLRFKTRSWWFEEEKIEKEFEGNINEQQLLLERIKFNFLAPPLFTKWHGRERK